MAPFSNYKKQPVSPLLPVAQQHPVTAANLPGKNKIPLKPGAILKLAPDEIAGLTQLGWKQGDPIPGDLPNILAAVQAEHQKAARNVKGFLPVPADTKPVVEKIVNIADLPEAQQEELRNITQNMIAREKAIKTQQPLPPGVANAINIAGGSTEFMQDTGNWSMGPTRDQALNPKQMTLSDLAAQVQAEKQNRTEPDEPVKAKPDDGSTFSTCQNCGWDLKKSIEPEPSDVDKYSFLALVLGSSAVRFRKEFSLFGGNLKVTFRALTSAEADLAWEQVGFDSKNARHILMSDQMRALQRYRMAISLESVEVLNKGITTVADNIVNNYDEETNETILPRLYDWISTEVVSHENILRTVEQTFLQFQRLVTRLEENVQNTDFWKGIGAQS